MPIFEYTCQKCKKTFEKLVLGKNQQPPVCPHCGAKKTEQKFSSFATAGTSARVSGGACAPTGGG